MLVSRGPNNTEARYIGGENFFPSRAISELVNGFTFNNEDAFHEGIEVNRRKLDRAEATARNYAKPNLKEVSNG